MRLGGPVFCGEDDPEIWARAHREAGYSAAFVPGDDARLPAFVDAAAKSGLVMAEVGAWSNPLSTDSAERKAAIDKCIKGLARAEQAGARCCVNIAGSRGKVWDGPDPRNLSRETFDMIVETTRQIIDAVRPTRTYYSLETMPWVWPDGPDEYLELVRAVDRTRFGVHLDPVNMINCPRRIFDTTAFLRECFEKLGAHVRSCHAKDIRIADRLTLHLDECAPGEGTLDYSEYLQQLSRLDPDTPLMLEHMKNSDDYARGAAHVRKVASENGVSFR